MLVYGCIIYPYQTRLDHSYIGVREATPSDVAFNRTEFHFNVTQHFPQPELGNPANVRDRLSN